MRQRYKPFYPWNDKPVVNDVSRPPVIDREIAAKVLRDLAHLRQNARRLDVEAAIWRLVARHARALTSEQIAEVTWLLLNRVAQGLRAA